MHIGIDFTPGVTLGAGIGRYTRGLVQALFELDQENEYVLFATPGTALRSTAVYAAVRIISESVASLPFILHRRLPDGGKERATSHPLYRILRFYPNDEQTAIEFWEDFLFVVNRHNDRDQKIFIRIHGSTYLEYAKLLCVAAYGLLAEKLEDIRNERRIRPTASA